MADDSTDISTKEELSICGRWLEDNGIVVEHFLGIVHVQATDAESLTKSLISFLVKGIPLGG